MRKKIIDRVLILLIYIFTVLFISGNMYGFDEPQVKYSDARVMGMGNTFVAIADDKNMLFFNPAGFAYYGLMKTSKLDAIKDPTLWKPRYTNLGDLTILGLTIGADTGIIKKYFGGIPYVSDTGEKPLKDIIDNDYFDKISEGTITEEEAKAFNNDLTQLAYTTLHPTVKWEYFSYARHYFGFGLFSTSDLVLSFEPVGLLLFQPVAQINSDLIFPIGFGMHIPGYKDWSVGVTFKYFQRVRAVVDNMNDAIALQQFFTGDYIKEDLDSELKSKSIWEIMFGGINYSKIPVSQFKIGTGYGFDIGVMYRPSYAWRYGFLLSDIYTKIKWWDGAESSHIKPDLRAGIAYMPGLSLWGIFEDPIFAMDIEDLFHTQHKNFFLKFHFGIEFKFLFRLLSVRAGIQDGYPSIGLGIDVSFYFLSKLPVFKYLRPDSIYFPKFNPKDKEFIQKNICCWCFTGLLAPILYSHIKIDVSYTGSELGDYPGELQNYQFLFKFSYTYSY